jgi:FAD-linked sulfhydryl oxidase
LFICNSVLQCPALICSDWGAQRAVAYMHSGCPLNRREVGRATWAYLHTMAAYYPERPSERQQKDMSQFMYTMAEFFPCGYCADKTVEELQKNPPRTASQAELAIWLCHVHNEVNERMGKPAFPCTIEGLRARWKTGPANGSCS